MSGRCKACDAFLDEHEMTRKWPGTSDFCDLCDYCYRMSEDEDYDYQYLDIDVECLSIEDTLDYD